MKFKKILTKIGTERKVAHLHNLFANSTFIQVLCSLEKITKERECNKGKMTDVEGIREMFINDDVSELNFSPENLLKSSHEKLWSEKPF